MGAELTYLNENQRDVVKHNDLGFAVMNFIAWSSLKDLLDDEVHLGEAWNWKAQQVGRAALLALRSFLVI